MSKWLEASQVRQNAWVAYMSTQRGTEPHRAAAAAYASACARLDALDDELVPA